MVQHIQIKLNRANCDQVPQTPGVYKLYDATGTHIYTGKASRLRHRISSWYQKDKSRPAWKRRLSKNARYFSYVTTNGKKDAAQKERYMLQKKKPRFNHYLVK